MIIGISGKIGSGKDTLADIINALAQGCDIQRMGFNMGLWDKPTEFHEPEPWEVKKYADTLKDMVCMLIGCDREQLEDREFKETKLGPEWEYWENDEGNKVVFDTQTMDTKTLTQRGFKWKTHTPRTLLQLLGTEGGRRILHPNVWVNALMSQYKEKVVKFGTFKSLDGRSDPMMTKRFPNWVVTDVRFPNEVEAIKKRGGIVIRLERDTENRFPDLWKDFQESQNEYQEWDHYLKDHGMLEKVYHPSETALDGYRFDLILDNNGTIIQLVQAVERVSIPGHGKLIDLIRKNSYAENRNT